MVRSGVFASASAWLLAIVLGPAPASADDAPLKVVMVSGSEEYESDRTLADLQKYLESRYPVRCALLKAEGVDKLSGLEALDSADVALFFTRRLTIDGEPLEKIKAYVEAGRPIVGVRTASHGFQKWLEFDGLVLGGNYKGHYKNNITVRAKVEPSAKDHPVVKGVEKIGSTGSLYKASPLAEGTTLLMTGTTPEGTEPVAWAREYKGARVVYTSLGAQGDFENASFLRLLGNALFWAAKREKPEPIAAVPPLRPRPEGTIALALRTRAEAIRGSGVLEERTARREVPAAETAIVVCDMWDKHWCRGATERCDAIAKQMEPVLQAARARGVQIIHAPSDCIDFYAGTPQRLRAQLAPMASPPTPREIVDAPLPIDDSDGGCDTDDVMYTAWTRQHPAITVGPLDAVSDRGDEVYNLLAQLGVKNLLVMGVHTNMCVLNRTFAIKQMARWGMNPILVRDLTDTMYDPKDRPFVPHDRGTEMVVEHIERYWAPSISASQLMEGLAR